MMRFAIQDAIGHMNGDVFRCKLSGLDADRWLELPAWMFERAPMIIAPFKIGLGRRIHADMSGLWAGMTPHRLYTRAVIVLSPQPFRRQDGAKSGRVEARGLSLRDADVIQHTVWAQEVSLYGQTDFD